MVHCIICDEKNAMAVQCGHTLCIDCVDALASSERNHQVIHPPCCHEQSYVPCFGGSHPTCAIHEDTKAVQDCLTCSVSLCSDCLLKHTSPAHHTLAETGVLAGRPTAQFICKDHEKTLDLYCITCQSLVCLLCERGVHRDHTCWPALDLLKSTLQKVDFKTFLAGCRLEIHHIRKLLVEAKDDVLSGKSTALEHCRDAAAAFEARVKADTKVKLSNIDKRLSALTALQRRVERSKAMLAAKGDTAEQLYAFDYLKKLAQSLTTVSVAVPKPLAVDASCIQNTFSLANENTEACVFATVPKMEHLCGRVFEFPQFQKLASSESPYTFAHQNRRVQRVPYFKFGGDPIPAQEGYCDGVHRWALRVKMHQTNFFQDAVGIMSLSHLTNNCSSNKWGFFLQSCGKTFSPDICNGPHYAAIPSDVECTMVLELDMYKHTLEYFIDGQSHGVAFRNLPAGPLSPAVWLRQKSSWSEFVPLTDLVPVENIIKVGKHPALS